MSATRPIPERRQLPSLSGYTLQGAAALLAALVVDSDTKGLIGTIEGGQITYAAKPKPEAAPAIPVEVEWLTAAQVSERLKISPWACYEMGKRGELETRRLGRKVRFSSHSLTNGAGK